MEKTPKVLKSCSNRSFPGKVWSDILSRIPVKSLVRFRCVSRRWRALIDDPVFARLHLTRSNNDESRVFVVQETSRGRECVVKCSKTLKTTAFLAIIETSKQSTLATLPVCDGEEIGNWNVSSSIDGLIMLMSWDWREQLMLWNPSIRKARRVPPCPEITPGMKPSDFGMGFDPLSEDYKHVVFVHNAQENLQFIAVYTVGTNSWKTIEFREKRGDSNPFRQFHCTPEARDPVCVGGVLYSLDGGTSFDLRSDTYDFNVRYPRRADPRVCCSALTTADCGRTLALVRFTHDNGYVWVLQGSTWTRRYKFALALPKYGCHLWDSPRVLYLKKNGEALLHWGEAITSSNLETNHEEKIMLEESSYKYGLHVWLYKESLLLLLN